MKEQEIQPDVNVVIADLTLQVANLTRDNAILRATIQAFKMAENTTEKEELQK